MFFWLKESSTCKASDPRSLASSRMKAPNCIRGCVQESETDRERGISRDKDRKRGIGTNKKRKRGKVGS